MPEKQPPSSNQPGRVARRQRGLKAKEHLTKREAEGTPRAVRRGRLGVRIRSENIDGEMFKQCTGCGHEAWKWQEECPKCGTALP